MHSHYQLRSVPLHRTFLMYLAFVKRKFTYVVPNLIEMTNKMQLCRTIYYSIVP
jgi:hypothetical protein